MGRLAFYDMCADKYRPIDKHSQQPYLTLGDGWIVRHYPQSRTTVAADTLRSCQAKDEMYRNYLAQNVRSNAVALYCSFVPTHVLGAAQPARSECCVHSLL
jgi:hypothetical protein